MDHKHNIIKGQHSIIFFQRSDEWKALIEDAEKRRKRIPVNLYNLEVGLRRCLKKNTTRPS